MQKTTDIKRTEKTRLAYQQEKALMSSTDIKTFDLEKEEVLKRFDYWAVIPNKFPYDFVFGTHHLLVPIRCFAGPGDMFDYELVELVKIKEGFGIYGEYDGFFENLPHKRSIPGHFHIHLMKWEEDFSELSQRFTDTDFDDIDNKVRSFNHWLIIKNNQRCENVFAEHHMLIPKRQLQGPSDITPEERQELVDIKTLLGDEKAYHGLFESWPLPKSFCIHFWKWAQREI